MGKYRHYSRSRLTAAVGAAYLGQNLEVFPPIMITVILDGVATQQSHYTNWM